MKRTFLAFFTIFILSGFLKADSGKKVFETYCWGCHHQTAVAFGPSFSDIASKRTAEEIQAMITDPASVSKLLGYKRNAMPPFKLTPNELKAITSYILSFSSVDENSSNSTDRNNKDKNKTIADEPYPGIAKGKVLQ